MSVTSTKQRLETLQAWIQFMKGDKVRKTKLKKRRNK